VEPALVSGAEFAGRDAAELRRWGWLITAIDDDDPQRAVREAKLQIAFYLTVRTYDSLVELHGWQDEVAKIRSAFRGGRPETIADHVTDDMLWSIAICGDSSQAREMLTARKHLPDLAFTSPPSFLVGRRRRARYDAAAIELMSQAR
jgi:hypothetical protein